MTAILQFLESFDIIILGLLALAAVFVVHPDDNGGAE
jgi:hypothetical protein